MGRNCEETLNSAGNDDSNNSYKSGYTEDQEVTGPDKKEIKEIIRT